LQEFPHILSTCLLFFLRSDVQLIPNHLNWFEVRWLWRPGHLMQHSYHSPSWSNSPYTASRWVGSLCCWKIVPLSANQIAPECCGSHITPAPPCFTVGTTHVEIIRSPTLHLTKKHLLEPKKMQIWTHQTNGQISNSLTSIAHVSWPSQVFFLLMSFSRGLFSAIRPWRPDSHSLLWTVNVEMCLLIGLCEAFIWVAIWVW
jgi:hypothetical protein